MGKSNRNDGKSLERITQDALQSHHLKHKSNYQRLYDKTSTGGRGFAMPGDFYWFIPGAAVLIECKSSLVCAPLVQLIKTSKTSKAQVPRHRLHHISGHPSIYLYGDMLNEEVTAYDGESVVAAVFDKKQGLVEISKADMSVGGLLSDILHYFIGVK